MGTAASIASNEIVKPIDGSDITSKEAALTEVIRLRQLVIQSTATVPDSIERVYDDSTGSIYFWDTITGVVSWEIPHALPPPTPQSKDISSICIESHTSYSCKLVKATRCVMKMLNRQKVRWEHDWHVQLLDYVAELRLEIDVLRKEQASSINADLVQHDVADKLANKMLVSVADRANEVTAIAEANAETHQKEINEKKAARHQALMVKLAARKKKHAEKLKERQETHDIMVEKINESFNTAKSLHGNTMREQHERTSSWHTNKEGIKDDTTCGWVMLYDASSSGVYYWHAEKGSTWTRPEELQFNLNLKQIGGGTKKSDEFETVGALSSGLLEKWYMDHSIEAEKLEDLQLEKEISDLEDELEKRRSRENNQSDINMVKVENVDLNYNNVPTAFLLA